MNVPTSTVGISTSAVVSTTLNVYIDIHLDVHGGCFYPGCDVSQSNDLVSIASTLDFEIVLKHITLVFRQASSES
jgi:hypothetical protein